MSDSWSRASKIIENKTGRFDDADLRILRETVSSLVGFGANRANVLNGRLAVEILDVSNRLLDVNTRLIDAVTKLDESSTRLVSTTNRLTTAILWLTALTVGLALAAVQVGIAAFTWWKNG